jgi:hypothetical protein
LHKLKIELLMEHRIEHNWRKCESFLARAKEIEAANPKA